LYEKRERERERERKRKGEGLKRGSENEIVKVAEQAQGIMEYETTSERRNEEGPRRWESEMERFGEPLNSRGPGLEAGFVAEPVYVYAVNEVRARAGE